jgi:RNA polymerase sigma factor (sigma-70 family)
MTSPSDTLLELLPLIERIIRTVCNRTMDATQIEEFTGFVHSKLVERDYSILRAYQERSSFATYLTTVIARLLNDHRNQEWGKWRSSAEAKRLGRLGVDLERLTVRDRRSLDEALIELLPKYPGSTRAALEGLAARFPVRQRHIVVALEEAPEPRTAGDEEERVANTETVALISAAVRSFVQRLPKEDQNLFYLRFECEMPVPQIANSLKQDPQSLYRRLRTLFADLREELERAGISAADIRSLASPDFALFDFQLKNGGGGPSNDGEPGAGPKEDA